MIHTQRKRSSEARSTSQSRGRRALDSLGRGVSHEPSFPRQNRGSAVVHSVIPQRDELGRAAGSLLYRVGPGNNSELIESTLLRRGWRASQPGQAAQLKWQQSSWGYKYAAEEEQKTVFNHLEFHRELSNKQCLVRNLIAFCEANKLNAFQITPATFIIDLHDEFIALSLNAFVRFFNHNHPRKPRDKDALFLKKVRYLQPRGERRCQGNFYCRPILPSTFISDAYAWLLKPTFLNRGRGIHVFNDLANLEKLLNEYIEGYRCKPVEDQPDKEEEDGKEGEGQPGPKEEEEKEEKGVRIRAVSFVIQKYIDQPLLIKGRKFDIRVWVLVTQRLEVFIFKQGYVRTSCQSFNLEQSSMSNSYIHLTNNAVQKNSPTYQKYQLGNQLSFAQLDEFLRAECRFFNFRGKTFRLMKESVWLSVCSCKRKLNVRDRASTFQIFGYDFLMDAQLKPWLIEVNTNPCLEESSPLLHELIPRMLDDAFRLSVDLIHPPGRLAPSPPVGGYSDEINMWEFLGDLVEANRNTLNKRYTFVKR